jgi:hypothetical protein
MPYDPNDPFNPDDLMSSRTVAYPEDMKPDALMREVELEAKVNEAKKKQGMIDTDLLDTDDFVDIEEVIEGVHPDEDNREK